MLKAHLYRNYSRMLKHTDNILWGCDEVLEIRPRHAISSLHLVQYQSEVANIKKVLSEVLISDDD